MLSRIVRRVALVALVALAVAVGFAWRDAGAQGWIELGWWRLVADRLWHHADRWLPALGGAALVVTLLERLLRRRALAPRPMAVALAVIALIVVARVADLAGVPRPPSRPNLLLLSIDTLRADRVGAYGYARPTTPTLDARVAAEGVVFEHVTSQAPKTTPSHMTMLTSLYPCVHGVRMWEGSDARAVLSPRVSTLAEALRAAGYATAAFTAGGPMDRSRGFDQGFDVYKHGQQLERTLEWLAARPRGRPFFLFMHTYEAHDPYVPPPRQIERFLPGYQGPLLDVVARIRKGVAGWDRAHQIFWDAIDQKDPAIAPVVSGLYDGGIREMDDTTTPRLLQALDALGLAHDTLLVVTSDHGEAFGEHGKYIHEDMHREVIEVPLELRLPGRLPAGRRVAMPARLLDLMPTVLDLLGVPPPPDMEGRSLAALATGAADALPPVPLISDHSDPDMGYRYERVRTGDDVLLEESGVAQLYDLAADPGERHDVAAERPDRVAALRAVRDAWRAECARLAAVYGPHGPGVAPSADALRKLRALGYVQ